MNASLVVILLSAAVAEPTEVVRVEASGPSARTLQTPVITYRNPGNHQVVTLVGAVHLGEADYYRRLQAELDGHEHVLFEGVGGAPKPSTALPGPHIEQKGARLLGLHLQRDMINYQKANFIHADMEEAELFGRLKARGAKAPPPPKQAGPLPWLVAPLLDGALLLTALPHTPGHELARLAKRKLARQLADTAAKEDGPAMVSPALKRVVLLERNDVAFERLREVLDAGASDVAVFYGAAHLPDMGQRLERMGFEVSTVTWVDAWKL